MSKAQKKKETNVPRRAKEPKTLIKTPAPKSAKKADVTKPARTASKQAMLVTLLQRPIGATIDDMAKATSWQRHSVQGMMSGVLRKRMGLNITSEKEERGRVYRLTGSVSRP